MKKIKQIKAGLIGIEIENNPTAVVFDKKKKNRPKWNGKNTVKTMIFFFSKLKISKKKSVYNI